jgi:hypothetical protein
MIKLIEGLHLTATNKRHIAQMIDANMTIGQSGRLAYALEPIAGEPKRFRYHIAQRERDSFNRWIIRNQRGVIETK